MKHLLLIVYGLFLLIPALLFSNDLLRVKINNAAYFSSNTPLTNYYFYNEDNLLTQKIMIQSANYSNYQLLYYNENGNTNRTLYIESGYTNESWFYYGTDGKLRGVTSSWYLKNGEVSFWETANYYYKNKYLERVEGSDSSGDSWYEKYDPTGYIIESGYGSDSDNYGAIYYDYGFDINNRLMREYVYDENSNLILVSDYQYYNGNLDISMTSNMMGNWNKTGYKYDENENLIYTYTLDDSGYWMEVFYTYE